MRSTSLTVAASRDLIAASGPAEFIELGYRWKRRMAVVFVLSLAAGLGAWFLFQEHFREFESVAKILVRRERGDPLVGPDQTRRETWHDLSEEEINGEIELIRSDDVLKAVVKEAGLDRLPQRERWYRGYGEPPTPELRASDAVADLGRKLEITLPKKSNVITVRYKAADPAVARKVLDALCQLYLEKHLSVHRPAGQFEFFAAQAARYKRELGEAEGRLADFPRKNGTVAGQIELEAAVRRSVDLRLAKQETQRSIQETDSRIKFLESQLAKTPSRITTAVRKADNGGLVMQLRGTLLTLEHKRTELVKKFQPTYREVREVDEQIAQTRTALEEAVAAPIHDETTDRDQTYEWMRAELARARTELGGLRVRDASLVRTIGESEQHARQVNATALQQQDLVRTAKGLEENYQLYLRKREEARISDALDKSRILNVSIAQRPTTPARPTRSAWVFAVAGVLAAIIVSLGSAFVFEYLDRSLRNASEVQRYLSIPVLAVLPTGVREPRS
jgi:uncharacterized protein involved in exopolysaccharide biosynthesis